MKFDKVRELTEVTADYFFIYDAVLRAPAGNVVEIGCAYGSGSCTLVGAADERGQHCYLIDPLNLNTEKQPDGYEVTKVTEAPLIERLNKLGLDNWTYFKNYSWEIAKVFKDPTSFIFIDGNHRYECVRRDWEDWSSKVVPGGIIILHDEGFQGVGKLIREIVKVDPLGFSYQSFRGSGIFTKK